MPRHRQCQAISEVFAKKCPHCHGEGYIVEDFKFASPTAEGEYRAKAAKMKLPISGFKKNNNKKQNNNQQEQVMEQSAPLETTENPSLEAEIETKKRENKKSNSRNNKRNFNKKQLNENSEVKTAQTMITAEDEIKPVIEEPTPVQETPAEVEVQAETPAEEKPKRTRRPNRGGAKTKRQTRSKKTSEEKVEEE